MAFVVGASALLSLVATAATNYFFPRSTTVNNIEKLENIKDVKELKESEVLLTINSTCFIVTVVTLVVVIIGLVIAIGITKCKKKKTNKVDIEMV